MAKKPVNIRIEENLLQKFDRLEGTRTKNMEAAMQLYLQEHEKIEDVERSVDTTVKNIDDVTIGAIRAELKHKDELLRGKDAHITDLQFQLGYLQREHSKLSDRIPALPAPKVKKKWWRRR